MVVSYICFLKIPLLALAADGIRNFSGGHFIAVSESLQVMNTLKVHSISNVLRVECFRRWALTFSNDTVCLCSYLVSGCEITAMDQLDVRCIVVAVAALASNR